MAKTTDINPLTERHYTQLKGLRNRVQSVRNYLMKCRNCKLDVDEELKATDEQMEVINGLLKEFFPNQPS